MARDNQLMDRICGTVERVVSGALSDRIDATANLIEDLECDALDIVELSMAIEDEFDIAVSDHVVHSWSTVDDVYRSVDKILIGRG